MNGFELNKILASALLAILILVLSINIVNALYKPDVVAKRGYSVVSDNQSINTPQEVVSDSKTVVDIEFLMKNALASSGQNATKKCISCHTFVKDAPNKIGPDLWDIVGRAIGSKEGFNYSDPMKSHGGKWTIENLYHFLTKPRDFIKGTKMGFAGISDPKEIADIIAYLKTLSVK